MIALSQNTYNRFIRAVEKVERDTPRKGQAGFVGTRQRGGGGGSNVKLVTLNPDGGDGDPDDFTYELFERDGVTPIYMADGTTPVTGQTPVFRPINSTIATAGTIGFWLKRDPATGEGKLLHANEVYETGPCSSSDTEIPSFF